MPCCTWTVVLSDQKWPMYHHLGRLLFYSSRCSDALLNQLKHYTMLWTAKCNLASDFSSKCPTLPEHILVHAHIYLADNNLQCFCFFVSCFFDLERVRAFSLNPVTAMIWCLLKTTNKSAKFEILTPFSSFSQWHVKGFSSKCTSLKVAVSRDRKIYCLQARPCIIQPGNFTCWGNEGVNISLAFFLAKD